MPDGSLRAHRHAMGDVLERSEKLQLIDLLHGPMPHPAAVGSRRGVRRRRA